MNRFPWLCFLVLVLTATAPATRACIWDADTLDHEKSRSKDLAIAILGTTNAPTPTDDPAKLRARIADLQAHPNENSADWWNNLAGAYLRLNQPAEAVKLLEPIVAKFSTNYGVHANLGTAYHLLSRYADAGKEIARDLEINPDAHFGLEKYHLALLQYLVRDVKYQARHVYVDELTTLLLAGDKGQIDPREVGDDLFSEMAKVEFTNGLAAAEQDFVQRVGTRTNSAGWDTGDFFVYAEISTLDPKPEYRSKWNLADDTNLEAGVIYMAQMNPKEPACATMLGVVAWKKREYHLAIRAFEKAIALNSPQADLLRAKIEGLKYYAGHSSGRDRDRKVVGAAGAVVVLAFALFIFLLLLYLVAKIRAACQ